ncbi:hypothetical protein S40293_08262 [Stachybotrys chartarum IBT 40293]|nr:hypothetical protein S40293_08262 [Stachybotrys chartarum IBT 40293]
MEPSGADKGFFQKTPPLPNQFCDDTSFQRCFKLFLTPEIIAERGPEVQALASEVLSDEIFGWIRDAERNKPYVSGSGRGPFGEWRGELVTGEGWRRLQAFGQAKCMVATGYSNALGPFSRPLQFLRLHLWQGSCANVTCPSAMQDGAASLLHHHLHSEFLTKKLGPDERRAFQDAYSHLTSNRADSAWTSGQWMTERTGGSDVSRTETIAAYNPPDSGALASSEGSVPLGPWAISGFKWFSSATDADMAVLLARTRSNSGLSAFFAPLRIDDPSANTLTGLPNPKGRRLNGVRISRLKDKFGTKSLPTAELVLEDMRGWMIGEEGKGIQEIGRMLTITRIHSAVAAVGYAGRSLGIVRAYARIREVGAGRGTRQRLDQTPLHMATLAKMTAEYRGLMLLTIWSSYILGLSEHNEPDRTGLSPCLAVLSPDVKHVTPLLRVLAPLTKAYVCKAAVPLIFSCMESIGGVGYLENESQEHVNIARIFRDCCALPIWEGTTDVLSTDFLRALKHPKSGKESIDAVESAIHGAGGMKSKHDIPRQWELLERWGKLRQQIENHSQENLVDQAREIIWGVGDLLVSILLYVDAASDDDTVAQEIFRRFVQSKFSVSGFVGNTQSRLNVNRAIVYGWGEPPEVPKL